MRLAVFLVLLAVSSALGVVAAQHKARRLFSELEREQARMRQLEVEWGQLQLEQSTWAAHGRVEKIARSRLAMESPAAEQVVAVGGGAAEGAVRP